MAITAIANHVDLILSNDNRGTAVPPVVFPGINPTNAFSWSIWVRATTNLPTWVTGHNCQDGSQIIIYSDGTSWFLNVRNGATTVTNFPMIPIVVGRWTLFCVSKNGPDLTIYSAVEAPLADHPELTPVTLSLIAAASYTIDSPLYNFIIVVMGNADYSCFKFWNAVLTRAQFEAQAQSFDATGSPAPIWASPLRTPGDLSSIANPYTGFNWGAGHAYNLITPADSLRIVTGFGFDDPAYMSFNSYCPTWVYPLTDVNFTVNPGLSPLVPTTYESPQLVQFRDVGSVPFIDYQIQSIKYYGFPYSVPPGWAHSETWGVYFDENGGKFNPISNTIYRFEPDTVVDIPGGPITPNNMYKWKFGAQFTYQPTTPQQATAAAHLSHPLLLVTYLGFPTGIPFSAESDLSGLFAVAKLGAVLDRYNNSVELKIPDPTIRTAYIGE